MFERTPSSSGANASWIITTGLTASLSLPDFSRCSRWSNRRGRTTVGKLDWSGALRGPSAI